MRKIWDEFDPVVLYPTCLTQLGPIPLAAYSGEHWPATTTATSPPSSSCPSPPWEVRAGSPHFCAHMMEQHADGTTAAPAPTSYLTRFTMTMATPTAAQRGQVTQPENQKILKEWGKFWPLAGNKKPLIHGSMLSLRRCPMRWAFSLSVKQWPDW